MKILDLFKRGFYAVIGAGLLGLSLAGNVRGEAITPVDLQSHYNWLAEQWEAGKCWSGLPQGGLFLEGVPFQSGGVIQLGGIGPSRFNVFHRLRVKDIAINAQAKWVHLLYGCEYSERPGTPVFSVVLHYRSGEQRGFNLAYGSHMLDWWERSGEGTGPALAVNVSKVWTGTSKETDQDGAKLRLYRHSIKNPLPNEEIRAVELRSFFSGCAPFILGLSYGGEAENAQENAENAGEIAQIGEGKIKALSPDGEPLSQAKVAVRANVNDGEAPLGSFTSDDQGVASLEYPQGKGQTFQVSIAAPGYATRVQPVTAAQLAAVVEIKLDPGMTIGGMIKSESGKPVPDAKITILGAVKDIVGQMILVDYQTVTSDAQGVWRCNQIPKNAAGLSFKLAHADYIPAVYEEATAEDGLTNYVTRADLEKRQAVMVLLNAILVQGTVTDAEGAPAAKAGVILRTFGENAQENRDERLTTDEQGRFKTARFKLSNAQLVVCQDGLAPFSVNFEVKPGMTPWTIKLAKGRQISGQVVDESTREPLAKARIGIAWKEMSLPNGSLLTDAEGKFSWSSAPAEAVQITASMEGYDSISRPDGGNNLFKMKKKLRVYGTVVDADTGKPVPRFTVTLGYFYGSNENDAYMNWQFYNETQGSQGSYSVSNNQENSPEAKLKCLVRAEGYVAMVSKAMPNSGWQKADFRLKPGRGPRGVVRGLNDKPLSGVKVGLLGVGYISLDKASLSANDPGEFVMQTDAQGRFELPAMPLTKGLVAVHETGFLLTQGANLDREQALRLEPWARIEGVAMAGSKPWTNINLIVHGQGSDSLGYSWSHFKISTDEAGRFSLDFVPPGARAIAMLVPAGKNSWSHSHTMSLDIKAGETKKVAFGGTGRPVIGKVVVSDPSVPRAYQNYNNNLRQLKARRQSSGNAYQMASFPILIQEDGKFRVENVPSGQYALQITICSPGPNEYQNGPVIGNYNKQNITVPEYEGEFSDEPLDLGDLKIELKK